MLKHQKGVDFLKPLKTVLKGLNKSEEALLCALFFAMTVICFVQVISRYVFSASIIWSEEFLRACFVWASGIGIACAFKYGTHLGVDFFVNLLPKTPRKIVVLVAAAIAGGFCAMMCIYGVDFVAMQIRDGRMTNALGIPSAYISVAIPIGCALACIRIVQSAWPEFRKEKNQETELADETSN
jgi:C4-dicarboxylate transporter DctQ subunit